MSAVLPAAVLPSREAPWAQRAASRLVGSRVFWAVFVALGFTLPIVRSVLRQLPPAPAVLAMVPAIHLVDEAGQPFALASFRGRLTIAEFAAADAVKEGSPLRDLQRRVRNTGNAVHLVSFVKGVDNAAALAELGKDTHAGAWRWSFVGGDVASLETALTASLKRPLDGQLILVDGSGRVRRVVSTAPADVDLLMRDVGYLANFPDPKESR